MSRFGLRGIELTGVDAAVVAGGAKLPVMIYKPNVTGRVPAVVLCPGGTGTGLFEVMEWIAAALRDAGIAAVTTSWRGSSPEFDPDDISAVIDWLVDEPGIDAARIGTMGMSRGANAALRAAALDRRLRAVATFGAVTHLLQQAQTTVDYAPGRHRMFVEWLGDPVLNRDFYHRIQAISYADRIGQPVLMVHGQHDMHAPPEQSIWMKQAIERGGNVDVKLEMVPMMGHYGDVVPNSYGFDILAERIVPFFLQRL